MTNLTSKEKAAYGVGAVGKDLVYMLCASYILYFYQDILGINAIFTGILLMAARVFDAINDPIMGVLVAKTKTKFGKFRPWLLSGTVLNALVLFAMFSVPESITGTPLLIYCSVTYILWGLTYTMMDIPFWSMIPAFTTKGKERESLSTLGRACAGIGSALAVMITMQMVYLLGGGNERVGFKWFSLIVSVLFIISAIIVCFFIKEKSTVNVETTTVKNMFKALIANDQAMVIVGAIVLINTSIYLTSNLVIYLFKYDIGGEGWYNSYTLFNTFGGAMQILAMAALYPLVRKVLSTRKVFFLSIIMAIVGYLVLLYLVTTKMNNVFVLFVPGFFIFASVGLLNILTTVFLANAVDYGEAKNGRRDESVIFSMQTFVVKLASGIAVLIASISLSVFNISDNTNAVASVTNEAVMGLRLTMTVLPIIGLVIALILFKFKSTLEEN